MMNQKIYSVVLCGFLCLAGGVLGDELLVNGDFQSGTPTDDKSASFESKGWRRELWADDAWNSWLTDGTRDREIGKDNQALQFRWGATSVYQHFSASAKETYRFSVDFYNAGTSDSRWQPRIQVEWFDASGQRIGETITVAEADNAVDPAKTWNTLSGAAEAPSRTATARIMLNVNNRGAGKYFQTTFLDNASVRGEPGTGNLPVSFISSPYSLAFLSIPESELYTDSLSNYADDKDGDSLKFTKVSGPEWLSIDTDGTMSGIPPFSAAGDNEFIVSVDDGNGSSDACMLTLPVVGKLRLANLFSDHMMLQRNRPVPIFGKDLPGSTVTIEFNGQKKTAKTNARGEWRVLLDPMSASLNPMTLSFRSSIGNREATIDNLLVGDVWLCSGQSNMQWLLGNNIIGGPEEIASANYPHLRLLKTPQTISKDRWDDLGSRAAWTVCSPDTAGKFSATAYYFGRTLQTDLNIPIGLISSSQGGTQIEKWAVNLLPSNADKFYNSRVHPYTHLPIKGVIWYQGEANVSDGKAYTAKMQTLIRDWRSAWNLGDLPFYFVQLAPCNYKGDAVYNLPELWAAQTAAMELIPNTGMAIINDVGDISNIHPKNKEPVGERLALWAKYGAYGQTHLVHTGPMVREVTREGTQLRVAFNHIGGGLVSRDGQPLNWFEIAAADQVFSVATAVMDGETILVSAPSVSDPEWVRFAWHETAEPNLMNAEGLPANSFMKQRTIDGE